MKIFLPRCFLWALIKGTRKPHSGNKKSGKRGKKASQPDSRVVSRTNAHDDVSMATSQMDDANKSLAVEHEQASDKMCDVCLKSSRRKR